MRFGLFGLNFGPCADPELAIRVAVAAEEAGFDSVWTGEHVAMPVRDNPVPTPAETPILDSLIALANVAAHTRRLRLGTGILVLPHHNPVLLAKALTTLDLVSGGRLIAGFGGGYVEAEFRALGVSFKDRGAITDEYLEAIRVLWTEELPRFQGRHAAFDGIRFEPKPRQPARPRRAARGDGARARRSVRARGLMQTVEQVLDSLSNLVWGWPLLVLLVGMHLYLTVRLRVIQRHLGTAIRLSFSRTAEGEGDVSHFGALTTALAATIGTGNIVGVATAVH